MSEAEKLRDLLTNAQMPDNATLTVTLGELRAAFGSSDPDHDLYRLGYDSGYLDAEKVWLERCGSSDPEAVGLDAEDWAAIDACLSACANDPREPERYRTWYSEVLDKVRRLTEAKPESPAPARRSRRTLTDLRDEAERRGITWWDDTWTRADFETALAVRLNPSASDDAYERGRADERKAHTFLIEHTPREPGPVDLRPVSDDEEAVE
jgi:hypothetical protein